MKEQIKSLILPELPIIGTLKVITQDSKSLTSIEVIKKSPPSAETQFSKNVFKEFSQFLHGRSTSISIPIDTSHLTKFQQSVYIEMMKIPYGEVVTYKDLAHALRIKGYQAIGSACGRNPFLLIVPCHRIVATNGLGGFAHGLKMKTKLLELEGSKTFFT